MLLAVYHKVIVIGVVIIRAGQASRRNSRPRGDRGNSPAHPRPRRANPLTVVFFGYYAEYSKRETRLFGRPRNAAGTYESTGAGRETDWRLREVRIQPRWGSTDFHQMAQDLANFLWLGDHGKHLHGRLDLDNQMLLSVKLVTQRSK